MTTIVTHTSPDLDAITGVWLLQRYGGLGDAAVAFVNTGSPDPDVLAAAAAVVDTGRCYDPGRLRFDHHHDPALPSAATLVWEALDSAGRPVAHLRPLVEVVNAHDLGQQSPEAAMSRAQGLHAIYAGGRPEGDDAGSLAWGYQLLDALDTTERRRAEGRALLDRHTAYRSGDGLLVALRDAPPTATAAAFERGARLVVFSNYAANTIGVQRAMEWQQPHVGDLVALAETSLDTPDAVAAELASWYRHPAGFFAGRGTSKAPSSTPIGVDVTAVARALDARYER